MLNYQRVSLHPWLVKADDQTLRVPQSAGQPQISEAILTDPRGPMVPSGGGSLWQTYKKLWKIAMFNGKIHYTNGRFFP